jgi:acyl-coenzyme A thioesterase PaaI-like protein
MPESFQTSMARMTFNLFPAYRGTGGRITYIARDWSEIRIRLPLSWRTRNYVGTIYGGSMYGAVDPVYMIMLIRLLGDGYIVWDKSASIRFVRPGRATLHATFVIDPQTVADIQSDLASHAKTERVFSVELLDAAGEVHAVVEKRLHISHRSASA